MSKKENDKTKEKKCNCCDHDDLREDEKCTCGCDESCNCGESCNCDDECDCGCQSGESCTCGCSCEEDKESEYLLLAKSIKAEFENYRKRTQDELGKARQEGICEAVQKFLPAIDSIKKSIELIKDKDVLKGLKMIETENDKALKNMGVEEMEVLNKPFDANISNAIAIITDNSLDDGTVVNVVQAGYKTKNKIIRFPQVVVSKKDKKGE